MDLGGGGSFWKGKRLEVDGGNDDLERKWIFVVWKTLELMEHAWKLGKLESRHSLEWINGTWNVSEFGCVLRERMIGEHGKWNLETSGQWTDFERIPILARWQKKARQRSGSATVRMNRESKGEILGEIFATNL